ncbi:MAG: hypothetical protein ACAI34_11835 [Verrucomicrobium sp.]|nr:hypothetical protein [Verrucomicrobium sp.]
MKTDPRSDIPSKTSPAQKSLKTTHVNKDKTTEKEHPDLRRIRAVNELTGASVMLPPNIVVPNDKS